MSNFKNSIFALSNSLGFNLVGVEEEMYAITQCNHQTLLSSVVTREDNERGTLGSAWVGANNQIEYLTDIEILPTLKEAFKFATRNFSTSLTYKQKMKLLQAPWILIEDHLSRNATGSLEKLVEWLSAESYAIPLNHKIVSRPSQNRASGIVLKSAYGVVVSIVDRQEEVKLDTSDEFVELDRPA